MRPFEKLLADLLELGSLGGDTADIKHLKRWREDGRADEIWRKLCKGPKGFDDARAAEFVMIVLKYRQIAEVADPLNKESLALARKGKRVAAEEFQRIKRMFDKSEISLGEYLAHIYRIYRSEPARRRNPGPLLSVRSNKNGTRRRTIFIRMLSEVLHNATGRWHDEEVGALCEIAFKPNKDIEIETVRSVRRDFARQKSATNTI
jgi:hypothetical protein